MESRVRVGISGMKEEEIKNAGTNRRRGVKPLVSRIEKRRCHS